MARDSAISFGDLIGRAEVRQIGSNGWGPVFRDADEVERILTSPEPPSRSSAIMRAALERGGMPCPPSA